MAKASAGASRVRRLVDVRGDEVRALGWSFAYFFCLLCSYYVLRPVRDEMGIAAGVENLQWAFTGTLLAMLLAVPVFGAAAARWPRRLLLPRVYGFFIANLLLFFMLFHAGFAPAAVARTFFIWVSVFNLFAVSVFWSYMADLFDSEQARRLFGFIAAGGSAGALVGPALTAGLARVFGPFPLLLVSALLLAAALVCIRRLGAWADTRAAVHEREAVGGGLWAGLLRLAHSPYLLAICLYIWLYTTLSTFLYFEQAHIVAAAFHDPGRRTAVFAGIDLAVNALTLAIQVLLTGRLVRRIGLPLTLALIPGVSAAGFLVLGLAPVLPLLLVFQTVRRAGGYAIARPAREMLFTVVGREDRYKAKNAIDTVIYRGGDAVSGWLFAGLSGLGLGLSALALVAVPVALAGAVTGAWLGRRRERRAAAP